MTIHQCSINSMNSIQYMSVLVNQSHYTLVICALWGMYPIARSSVRLRIPPYRLPYALHIAHVTAQRNGWIHGRDRFMYLKRSSTVPTSEERANAMQSLTPKTIPMAARSHERSAFTGSTGTHSVESPGGERTCICNGAGWDGCEVDTAPAISDGDLERIRAAFAASPALRPRLATLLLEEGRSGLAQSLERLLKEDRPHASGERSGASPFHPALLSRPSAPESLSLVTAHTQSRKGPYL